MRLCGICRKEEEAGAVVRMVGRVHGGAGRAAPTAFERGDRPANGPDRQWLRPTIFRRPKRGIASRGKIAGLRRPPLRFGPALRSGCRSGPPAGFGAHEGRDGRGQSDGADHEQARAFRTTAQFLSNRASPARASAIRLSPLLGRARPETFARRRSRRQRHSRYFRRPDRDASVTRALNPISKTCSGRPSTSSIAPQAGSSANSTTTSRRSAASQKEQDGSEVKSVELERLISEGQTLIERRDASN